MDQSQPTSSIEDITENFSLLEEWDDRYRYVIELGRRLPPFPEDQRTDRNKVPGCVSQVWLATSTQPRDGKMIVTFQGDSDAHIVRGLVAILIALLSGRPASEIVDENPIALFEHLGLGDHLTPQRSNGFRSMVTRMKADAMTILADAV